jgi:hypothetical protein
MPGFLPHSAHKQSSKLLLTFDVLIVSLTFVWAETLREIAAIVVDRKISGPFVCITAISTFLLTGGSAKPLSRARLFLLLISTGFVHP